MSDPNGDRGLALAQSLGQLLSVTRVLAEVGLGPNFDGVPSGLLERKRLLGTALHQAIRFDVEGALDEVSIHPDIAGAFQAYRRFQGSGFLIRQAELEWIDPVWRVVGHPDAVGNAPNGSAMLVDWKFTESLDLDAVAYQLAGYCWLAGRVGGGLRMPYAVELHADGDFRLHAMSTRIKELNAEQVFLAALTVAHARRRRG